MSVTECPQCGAPAAKSQRHCEYCKAEFFINSVSYLSNFANTDIQKYLQHYKKLTVSEPDNYEGFLGLGICYLQLNMYPLAVKAFEQVIDKSPDVAPAYYYHCLATIAGRGVKSLPLAQVEQIVAHLNTANVLDPENAVYLLLRMIINNDYYIANYLREPKPSFAELRSMVDIKSIDVNEIDRIKMCVTVPDFDMYGI